MPRVIRKIDPSEGADNDSSLPKEWSGDVFANDEEVVREGDEYFPHPDDPDHEGRTAQSEFAPNVFVNDISVNITVDGDPISCTDKAANGSLNVFAGSLNGAGGIIENGRQFEIPVYGKATTSSGYFFEHDDPDSPGSPPSDTSERPMKEEKDDQKEAPDDPPPAQDCSDADALPNTFSWSDVAGSFSAWAPTFQLSPNFTVASLTIGTSFPHSFPSNPTLPSGLTQKQTIQNLCFLAKTVLEPMKASYGNFLITSGWRSASGASQHNKGQAADCQFTNFHPSGMTGTQYFERAQNIRDNINFDQMILEWFGNNPWIHVSSNSAGHRHMVLTQTGQSSYSPGLKLLRAT